MDKSSEPRAGCSEAGGNDVANELETRQAQEKLRKAKNFNGRTSVGLLTSALRTHLSLSMRFDAHARYRGPSAIRERSAFQAPQGL